MQRLIAFLAASMLFWSTNASAQTNTKPAIQVIAEQTANHYIEAFNNRDATALSKLFTDEAEYVDVSGTIFHGRPVIEAEFAANFAVSPPGTLAIEMASIRQIAHGVMVEDGVASFNPEGDEATIRTLYTTTHVKQNDGSWLMASVRELSSGTMSSHEQLKALTWLLGDWHEDVRGVITQSTWDWSEDENFLVGTFTVEQSDAVSWTGTHRIAWDAERNQFHSWVFESHGGTTEGWWEPNPDGSWSVNMSGIDASGVRRSARLTYLADGDDAIVVSETQRLVNGTSLPPTVHRVVRKPPAVEAPKNLN
ncbi:hypothetical protein KOR42_53310 [Thalassoglobus neptunius]|uniref:DUF4440 domain-containing protein n=1 Tax=Thalassoglobus neptunius TaxID=1938619 RepID=A0A5C5V8S9_9PLAN|nr:nuclear transport factor 2 family protein [Thalassoglobus neptunius]TWT34996.1 hypothetical protein KOR42_53310 [Thalassoglobus neptunius]